MGGCPVVVVVDNDEEEIAEDAAELVEGDWAADDDAIVDPEVEVLAPTLDEEEDSRKEVAEDDEVTADEA